MESTVFMAKKSSLKKTVNVEFIGAVFDSINCIGNYEVPGQTLKHRGQSGMHLYGGFLTGEDFRIRIYVPTSIYDHQTAQILAYEAKTSSEIPKRSEKLVALERVRLESMPVWDNEACALVLNKRDDARIIRAANKLEKKLSEG